MLLLNPIDAVERGYAVVVQEVRGRAGSEASWHPFVHELEDGEDCLDWVLAQPWCDGRIGTYGTAYSASTALYLAASGRDEVKALAVLGTGADIHDGWVYTSGAFELGWNVYWAYMTATETIEPARRRRGTRGGAAGGTTRGRSSTRRPSRRGCPISDHPLLDRVGETQYREWLEHPDYDDYWASFDVLALADRCALRCSRSSGWHDNFLKSHFDLYRATAGQAPHRLVVGPWEHTSYVSPFSTSRSGAVEFGPAAASGVGCLDPARARLVRPLDHGRRQPAPPEACATGNSERTSGARPTPGRRRTPSSAGTSAPAVAPTVAHGDGVSRRRPRRRGRGARLVSSTTRSTRCRPSAARR